MRALLFGPNAKVPSRFINELGPLFRDTPCHSVTGLAEYADAASNLATIS